MLVFLGGVGLCAGLSCGLRLDRLVDGRCFVLANVLCINTVTLEFNIAVLTLVSVDMEGHFSLSAGRDDCLHDLPSLFHLRSLPFGPTGSKDADDDAVEQNEGDHNH